MKEHAHTVIVGLIGIAFPTGGIYVSFLPALEAWLRIVSLSVGISVGLASLYAILKGVQKRRDKQVTEKWGDD